MTRALLAVAMLACAIPAWGATPRVVGFQWDSNGVVQDSPAVRETTFAWSVADHRYYPLYTRSRVRTVPQRPNRSPLALPAAATLLVVGFLALAVRACQVEEVEPCDS